MRQPLEPDQGQMNGPATKRTNETWLDQLDEEAPERPAALADLRNILLGGLRASIGNRTRLDDSSLEDIAQESLLKILEKKDQFAGRSRFTTWASSIAVRTALSEARRRAWKDVSLEDLESGGGPGKPSPTTANENDPSVEIESERRSLFEALDRLIEEELTDRQRLALRAELDGMPLEEIARRIDSNRNAVYKLTHDARKRLKKALEEAGFGAAMVRSLL